MAYKKYRVSQTSSWFRVRAASTANVTVASLDAGQVMDGLTLAANDYVLLKNQTTATENGVYKINADTVAPTRAATENNTAYRAGFDSSGSVVRVTAGTANAGKCFLQYSEPGVVGTDSLVYIEHPRT